MTDVRFPSAATKLCAVIGDPVRHSLSPIVHNAAFAALGLDWMYVALRVAEGNASAALEGMRTFAIEGLSITMPHKEGIFDSVDRVTDRAERLKACNTVFRDGSDLVGDSTDGDGFVRSLIDIDIEVSQSHFVVVGAGGAGRSVVAALNLAGAASITIVNRDQKKGNIALGLAGLAAKLAVSDDEVRAALATATVAVNATSLGMRSDDALPLNPDDLRADQTIIDLIYHPAQTPLLQQAARIGCRTANGVSMLLHQATLQCELWTGMDAPIEVMRAALSDELARRAQVEPS